MARIRSIHPGLYTDEAFVSLSLAARVLLPGVWTECDDHGIFEWKPVTLKMKIFPADNIDVVALLVELLNAGSVKKFVFDGKEFGVARNFSKYQRPKNPSYRYTLPEEHREYSGLKPPATPSLPEASPSTTEIPPQMEDGGDSREVGKKELRPKRVRTLCSDDFEIFWKTYPRTPNMSKSEAWKAWQRLSDEDRVAATAAVPKYIAFLRSKTDHPTVHACRFLSQRRFDGFNEAVSANAQQTAEIFVPLDSPKWGLLATRWREKAGKNTGPPPRDYPVGTGWYFPSEWVA